MLNQIYKCIISSHRSVWFLQLLVNFSQILCWLICQMIQNKTTKHGCRCGGETEEHPKAKTSCCPSAVSDSLCCQKSVHNRDGGLSKACCWLLLQLCVSHHAGCLWLKFKHSKNILFPNYCDFYVVDNDH